MSMIPMADPLTVSTAKSAAVTLLTGSLNVISNVTVVSELVSLVFGLVDETMGESRSVMCLSPAVYAATRGLPNVS